MFSLSSLENVTCYMVEVFMYIQVYGMFCYHYYHYSHLISSSPWANVTFQCCGKSMRQKFPMRPQTIPVDLSTKDKNHHMDSMDKGMIMHTHTHHPLLRIFKVVLKISVFCWEEKIPLLNDHNLNWSLLSA